MPLEAAELEALRNRRQHWALLKARAGTDLHQRLHVETDLAPASLTARATVAWPQIVASPVLACGAVHVGSSSTCSIDVRNRAASPVWVELLLPTEEQAEQAEAEQEEWVLKRGHRDSVQAIKVASAHHAAFGLPKRPADKWQDSWPLGRTPQEAPPKLHLIPPGGEARIGSIRFSPTRLGAVRSTVYLRSNLTWLDEVLIVGDGGGGRLAVLSEASAAKAERGDPIGTAEDDEGVLRVTLSSEELAGAESKLQALAAGGESTTPLPHVFVKSFTLTNRGNLNLRVDWMSVQPAGSPARQGSCSHGGFSVAECASSFSLAPGSLRRLDVVYEADFRSELATAELEVHSSTGTVTFPLEARLRQHMLIINY